MASRAKHHRNVNDGPGSETTQLRSINSTGLVFVSGRKFPVTSEISLSVQTSAAGREDDWTVRGLVVECRNVKRRPHAQYQITLLFSELPEGLKELMSGGMITSGSFIPLKNCALFGLN